MDETHVLADAGAWVFVFRVPYMVVWKYYNNCYKISGR